MVEHDGDIVAVLALDGHRRGLPARQRRRRAGPSGQGDWAAYLLEYAESEARRQGFDSIHLYAQEIMTENLALYRRIGYVEYARRVEFGLPRVYLRKPL